MNTNTIIVSLFALGATLGLSAQEMHTERLAGHELIEVRHEEQRVTLPTDPVSVDSLIQVRTVEIRTFVDTLRTVTSHEHVSTIPGDSSSRKGHYVEIHAGAGVGNTGYGWLRKDLVHPTAKGYEQFGISGVVQLQYAYFFHPNVGLGIGAWLSNYTSHGYLSGDFVFNGLTQDANGNYIPDTQSGIQDSQGEYYNHHADVRSWHERQTIHTVGVPISLQFQAWGKQGKAGFFASLGAAPAYTVKTDYRVLSGQIEHWGDYKHRDAQIHNAHEFTTIDYANRTGKQSIKQITASAFVDLGLLIRMSPHTDLLLGVYGQYAFLDAQDATPVDLGWKDSRFPNIKMEEYNGILATKCIADKNGNAPLHPWQAGVKIGLHWHSIEKPRTGTVLTCDTTIQMVEREDSIWTERIDTLQRVRSIERVQRAIDKLNRIYFDFDSHELTPESKRLIEQIAEQLKTIPNKVLIGGHASKEGTRAHNERLAKYRALMVKYYLVDCGIPATRMIVRDYGSTVANAINLHEDLSLDRRVEIIVQDE